MNQNSKLRQALSTEVVFHHTNAEKGEGAGLSGTYGVEGYPTYILMRPDGTVIDRWSGFGDAKGFLATLRSAKADPTTVDEKAARFERGPTLADGATLVRIYEFGATPEKAVRYLQEVQRLDPGHASAYAAQLLRLQYAAFRHDKAEAKDVKAAADSTLATPKPKEEDVFRAAGIMSEVARKTKDPSFASPYVSRALALAQASSSDRAKRERPGLEVSEALYVQRNEAKALDLKRAAMPKGWESDPESLNAFAWFCFQHGINLEQAEALARRGAELAPPGEKRAQILDTAAEICNARGNCGDAAALEAQAAKEDPAGEHYKKRQAEFEDLLAKQKGAASPS